MSPSRLPTACGRLFLEACRIRRSVSAPVHKVDLDCLDGDTALKPSVSGLQTCTPPSSANIVCRTWPLVPGPALVALPGPPFFMAHLLRGTQVLRGTLRAHARTKVLADSSR